MNVFYGLQKVAVSISLSDKLIIGLSKQRFYFTCHIFGYNTGQLRFKGSSRSMIFQQKIIVRTKINVFCLLEIERGRGEQDIKLKVRFFRPILAYTANDELPEVDPERFSHCV